MPIIAVSASGDEKECLAVGMQEFIQKPLVENKMLLFLFLSYCKGRANACK